MSEEPAVVREPPRGRTFAVISHPGAVKPTIPEASALHAQAIGEAGAAARAELIDAAVTADARNEVLMVLRDLPDDVFASPRVLWTELPDMPVSA
ncbi:DUF2795 domain-containing protein [Glycomyces arizonensis]|uniref:DUF2795 domain-containing protein n=1 Tax=Glycomyces arizonensis TaxID=256035 RepID=UPI000429A0E2|nr:DUF2795 domain-containing protein [Glycomyces arizonensis]